MFRRQYTPKAAIGLCPRHLHWYYHAGLPFIVWVRKISINLESMRLALSKTTTLTCLQICTISSVFLGKWECCVKNAYQVTSSSPAQLHVYLVRATKLWLFLSSSPSSDFSWFILFTSRRTTCPRIKRVKIRRFWLKFFWIIFRLFRCLVLPHSSGPITSHRYLISLKTSLEPNLILFQCNAWLWDQLLTLPRSSI